MTPEIPPDFFILLISLSILTQASPTRHPKENNTINSTQSSQNDSREELKSREPILLSSDEVLARPIDCPMLTPTCLPARKRGTSQAPGIQRSIDTPSVIDYNNL
uniref:Secreted protein n=1 Tax=Acrobeloides nanus TaxID=290746 RepID=A0A914E9K9_9BILA